MARHPKPRAVDQLITRDASRPRAQEHRPGARPCPEGAVATRPGSATSDGGPAGSPLRRRKPCARSSLKSAQSEIVEQGAGTQRIRRLTEPLVGIQRQHGDQPDPAAPARPAPARTQPSPTPPGCGQRPAGSRRSGSEPGGSWYRTSAARSEDAPRQGRPPGLPPPLRPARECSPSARRGGTRRRAGDVGRSRRLPHRPPGHRPTHAASGGRPSPPRSITRCREATPRWVACRSPSLRPPPAATYRRPRRLQRRPRP